jgi:hypothetical protein
VEQYGFGLVVSVMCKRDVDWGLCFESDLSLDVGKPTVADSSGFGLNAFPEFIRPFCVFVQHDLSGRTPRSYVLGVTIGLCPAQLVIHMPHFDGVPASDQTFGEYHGVISATHPHENGVVGGDSVLVQPSGQSLRDASSVFRHLFEVF